MSIYELWMVSPQSHIFIKGDDGKVMEYNGGLDNSDMEVDRIVATSYPMYRSVIEVTVKEVTK